MSQPMFTSHDLKDYARSKRPVIFIDIETTGISKQDEITEVGIYNLGEDREWGTLVKPRSHSANSVSHITGITDDMLKDAPRIEDAMKLVGDAISVNDRPLLIAHNGVRFDFPRLDDAFVRSGVIPSGLFDEDKIDSMNVATHVLPTSIVSAHSVVGLMRYYGIEGVQEHRASSDCFFTSRVLDAVLDDDSDYRSSNVESVSDLIRFSQKRAYYSHAHARCRKLLKAAESAELSFGVSDERSVKLREAYNKSLVSVL